MTDYFFSAAAVAQVSARALPSRGPVCVAKAALTMVLAALLALVSSHVSAQPLKPAPPARASATFTASDDREVRRVVQEQLKAFAQDDAARAFSFAAPNIRQAMGTAGNFMRMVRQGYPVVYRPASVAFLKAEGQADEAVQRVQMIDAAGESWLAVYTLQRQKNRQWRISGCVVTPNKGRMA